MPGSGTGLDKGSDSDISLSKGMGLCMGSYKHMGIWVCAWIQTWVWAWIFLDIDIDMGIDPGSSIGLDLGMGVYSGISGNKVLMPSSEPRGRAMKQY